MSALHDSLLERITIDPDVRFGKPCIRVRFPRDFILVSTDSDFEGLLKACPSIKVVTLRSCDYSTDVAAEVLWRNAIRITAPSSFEDRLIILDR